MGSAGERPSLRCCATAANGTGEMRADPYPLRQILSWERRYVIPTFQRDYEWNKDQQWELLADDLEAVAERLGRERHLAEVTGSRPGAADQKVSPHFLGAIVLDKLVPERAGGLDLRSVIDGQQRLTTLQLLVRALLDVALEQNSPRIRQLRRLLQNPDDIIDAPHEIHKLWPRRRDREVWLTAMHDQPPDSNDHLYLEARSYFAGRAREFINETEDGEELFDLLVDACLEMFKIVVIDLDDNDDAQVIFEVLNGRQTPLAAADLVKNLLFLRAEQHGVPELEDLYDDHWGQFDDDWWKRNVGRGHAARRHSSLMLSAWLTAASGQPAHPDRLYGQVRRHLDGTAPKIPELLAEISAYAAHYRNYQEGTDDRGARVQTAYGRLRQVGANTALPLLLWAREQLAQGQIEPTGFQQMILDVESYLMRRVIVGANTRGYGERFRDLLAAIQADGVDPVVTLRAELEQLEGNARWPTDEEVETAFVDRPFYDNVAHYVIRLVLSGIEEELRASERFTEDVTIDYDTLTIEHILPQAWQRHWPVDGEGAERTLAEQRRQRQVNKLGNLTLINGSFNSAQSNKPWAEKRNELARYSALRLNSHLVNDDVWTEWNEVAIDRRGRQLAQVACAVWARPAPE